MKVAVVGLGYWGPNLLRTFHSLNALAAAFDLDEKKLKKYGKDPVYKDIFFDSDWEKCLGRADVGAVVIATPPHTHAAIAVKAMNEGKHVFIEKPMALTVNDALKIKGKSEATGCIAMVGHIFLYSPEIIKLRDLVRAKEFGKMNYIYIQRLNLGGIQSPANVVEDLAPHDISIVNYLLDKQCVKVQAYAKAHVIDTEDVAFINMEYEDGTMANLHLSWLDPLKVRNIIAVGTKQMVVCDSMTKSISVYNKGVDTEKLENGVGGNYASQLLAYKYGDVVMPYIQVYEPMKAECEEFLNCIKEKRQPLANASYGFDVVKVLAAMQSSLKKEGKWVSV